ncbi:MAG: transcription initiation factor IIB [Nitrosopumilus sp.]|nr:transcription initiation factor IIB [Nitrosopumilus sp.]MDC4230937.1 transcription initiation factor IIB [Nitrosopumilus sp.]
MAQQLSKKQSCPRCGKTKLITDEETAELFCGKCGFVITDRVENSGPERTFSDSSTNKSRTGDRASLTRHDQGLSTIINPINKDSSGNPLSTSMKSSIKRLRIWDSRSRTKDSTDRNLQQALGELLKMKEKLSLSDPIVEKAAYIYRKALEKKLVRGRSVSALIAATLYAACRESGTPRTLNDISSTINITRKNLAICYRLIVKELDLKMPVVDSVQCIARIASQIGLSEKTKRHAVKILKKAEENQVVSGKDPMGLAASALYLASIETDENTTQKTLAIAAGVTEVTIRNRCKSLKSLGSLS